MWTLFKSKYDVSGKEAVRKVAHGWKPFIIDVRPKGESKITGVAKGTKLIQPHRSIAKAMKKIPKGEDILFICASGQRSRKALDTLEEKGMRPEHLHNLKGGITSWIKAGGDTKRPN